jgi:phosphatidylglycerol:prolipoprotein diacylglycerol transferase
VPAGAALSAPVHPTQLYEAAGALLVAWCAARAAARRRVPGEGFLAFGMGYGAVRFAVEGLRADNPPLALGLTLSQWVAAAGAATCAALLVARRRLYAPAPARAGRLPRCASSSTASR